MQKSAHFRVDPKLAHVLGESYTSSEKALKELVDNACSPCPPKTCGA